jgi:hypothetical protein
LRWHCFPVDSLLKGEGGDSMIDKKMSIIPLR